jgi:hypothetical protein
MGDGEHQKTNRVEKAGITIEDCCTQICKFK